MDVEKTIEFILEHEAKLQARMDSLTVKMEDLTEKMDAHTDRQIEMDDRFDRRMAEAHAQHVAEIGAIRAELRNGIRLAVEEQRRERTRRHMLEAGLTHMVQGIEDLKTSVQQLVDLQRPGQSSQ